MKALVTGSAGFIGQHMTRRLEADGHDVLGVDLVDGIDARDFFRLDDTAFDLVVHCAAVVGGRKTIEGAPLALAVADLALDAGLFDWALRTRPGRVVYFSSSAAYPTHLQGRESDLLLRESLITPDLLAGAPDLTYGWTKLTGEMLARHATDEGLRVHVFRPFSGYGPGQSLDYPFPAFIARAVRREDPFDIWGDGEQTRDFIHVDDIVNAVFAAIDSDVYGPVNLATGRPTTFNELAAMVCAAAGHTPEFRHLPAEPVGVHYRVGDPQRMWAFCQPKITLEEGVERALRAVTAAA